MHTDARMLRDGEVVSAGVAVFGAGPAGITLALELAGRGLSIVLVDSGVFGPPEPYAEDIARWSELGIRDVETPRCNRRVGGSTWLWGSHARPLDPIDFERREWVPHSGWPVTYGEMSPHFERAWDLLELRSGPGEDVAWDARGVPGSKTYDWPEVQFPLNRFGAVEFSQRASALRDLPGITIVTAAAASDVRLTPDLSRVDHVVCAVPGGGRIRVEAERYVLAAGGVENPAILLRSASQMGEGVGNVHGVVGRFLQGHPTFDCRYRFLRDFELAPAMQIDWKRALTGNIQARREILRGYYFSKLALAEGVQREHRLLNAAGALCGFRNFDAGQTWRDFASFVSENGGGAAGPAAEQTLLNFVSRPLDLLKALRAARAGRSEVEFFFTLQFACEQSPNPLSRVVLSGDRDALGNRRPALDWRITDLDRRSMRRTAELIGLAHESRGLAETRLETPVNNPAWPCAIHGGFHYIGTTRMGDDPRTSVVDRDCRVHGVDNLFIAGCSVFPTSGHAPPTLTLIALASRLAGRLLEEGRSGGGAGAVIEPKSQDAPLANA